MQGFVIIHSRRMENKNISKKKRGKTRGKKKKNGKQNLT